MTDTVQQRAAELALQQRAQRFLRWLHDDQVGYIEIVAGQTNPNDPKKIDLVMRTRRFMYLDPERPDLYAAAADYAAQLAATYCNVYTGIRLYTVEARNENTRKEAYTKPGRVIFIDDAPAAPKLAYSASIRTSEHSRHAYYKCAQNVTKDDARRAAAALGGDPSGVDLTQLVRFPGTFNTKHGGRWPVEAEPTPGTIYQLDALRSAWPAVAARLGTSGAAWGEHYKPQEWENLPDGGLLWHSPYIAAAAGQRRPDLEKLLRGERVTVIKKDDTRDDSDSTQVAALAYNLLSADVCKPQARAIADYLYTHIRPSKTREHYRAHFDAELERYTPKHYRPKEIRYTGAARQIENLPPAEHKPEPKSRARNDRPQRVSGAAGYFAWLCTHVDGQSGSVMLSQSQCAVRLGCDVRTIKRYEKALGTQIERRVFAQRQAGCLFILAPDVVTTFPADVVIADAEIPQQSAEIAQPEIIQVEHTAPPVPGLSDAAAWCRSAELAEWVTEAFDCYPGRANFGKVQKHVEMLADGRRFKAVTLKRLYAEELTRRRYAKQDANEAAKARAMRFDILQRTSRALGTQVAAVRKAVRDGVQLPEMLEYQIEYADGSKKTFKTKRPAVLTERYAQMLQHRAGIYAAEEARRQQAEQERIQRLGYSLTEQAEMLDLVDQVRPERQRIGKATTRGGRVPPNPSGPQASTSAHTVIANLFARQERQYDPVEYRQ